MAEEKGFTGRATGNADEDERPIRVTDRRRVSIDGASPNAETSVEGAKDSNEPSLKPSYVEEFEARTRAAEQKVTDVQSRFEQLRAQMQRETDETRARLNRAADERALQNQIAFINSLLPVMDNLQRALQAAEAGGSVESLLTGLRSTINGFQNALAAAGVETVSGTGAQFDPQLHEAVDAVAVDAERDGIITAEYSCGYRIGGRLLRPARVQVGHSTAAHKSATE